MEFGRKNESKTTLSFETGSVIVVLYNYGCQKVILVSFLGEKV